MGSEETKTESKRGRVRRLVIDPLIADGFRKRRETDEATHKANLDRIADALGYMSDAGLKALRASLATKGEGSARQFWPSFATVSGLANDFEKRPLEEEPELLRWFRSEAGREAMAADRLVAEYRFWTWYKRPPVRPADKAKVEEKASYYRDRAFRVRDRISRGFEPLFDDGAFLAWYEAQVAYVTGLVEGGSEEGGQ